MAKVVADEIAEKKFIPIRLEIILETKAEAEVVGNIFNHAQVCLAIRGAYGWDGDRLAENIREALAKRGVDMHNPSILQLTYGR